jgi:hypothetical protein
MPSDLHFLAGFYASSYHNLLKDNLRVSVLRGQSARAGLLAQAFVDFKFRFHPDQSMVEISHNTGEFADIVCEGRDSLLQRNDFTQRG